MEAPSANLSSPPPPPPPDETLYTPSTRMHIKIDVKFPSYPPSLNVQCITGACKPLRQIKVIANCFPCSRLLVSRSNLICPSYIGLFIYSFFFQGNFVGTFQANRSNVTIDGLSPCLSYWVVVASEIIGCGSDSSQPQAINLFRSSSFRFALSVEGSPPCREWIAEDFMGKVADAETALNSALEVSSCGMPVPCMASSQFTCEGSEIHFE